MNDITPTVLQPTPVATIVDVLNPTKEQRDSAYYSGASTNGDGSKREDSPPRPPRPLTLRADFFFTRRMLINSTQIIQ